MRYPFLLLALLALPGCDSPTKSVPEEIAGFYYLMTATASGVSLEHDSGVLEIHPGGGFYYNFVIEAPDEFSGRYLSMGSYTPTPGGIRIRGATGSTERQVPIEGRNAVLTIHGIRFAFEKS